MQAVVISQQCIFILQTKSTMTIFYRHSELFLRHSTEFTESNHYNNTPPQLLSVEVLIWLLLVHIVQVHQAKERVWRQCGRCRQDGLYPIFYLWYVSLDRKSGIIVNHNRLGNIQTVFPSLKTKLKSSSLSLFASLTCQMTELAERRKTIQSLNLSIKNTSTQRTAFNFQLDWCASLGRFPSLGVVSDRRMIQLELWGYWMSNSVPSNRGHLLIVWQKRFRQNFSSFGSYYIPQNARKLSAQKKQSSGPKGSMVCGVLFISKAEH